MTVKKKILLIDDDADFCRLLQSVARGFNFDLSSVGTVREAKQEIVRQKYDAFIVDGYLRDGSGVDIIAWMNKRIGSNHLLAFVSSGFHTTPYFKGIQDDLNINFILTKPLAKKDITDLFSKLTRKAHIEKDHNEGEEDSPFEDDNVLESLKREYITSVAEKITYLESILAMLKVEPSPYNLKLLQYDLHKLAGSAGCYGYHTLSKICKAVENDITKKLDTKATIKASWVDLLNSIFLPKMKKIYAEMITCPTNISPVAEIRAHDADVYAIFENDAFLAEMKKTCKKNNLSFLGESSSDKALTLLQDPDFAPKILLVSENFLGEEITGYDIIHTFKMSHPKISSTSFGILSANDEMSQRITALSSGVDFFISLPITSEKLAYQCRTYLDSLHTEKFKVLIIDDDPNICKHLESILTKMDVETKVLTSGTELFKHLTTFSPDLLLLDINLPHYDGKELLLSIRNDIQNKDLATFIITVKDDAETIKTAYALGAEEFITKPIIPEIFEARVSSFIKKHNLTHAMKNQDPLTGLPNRRAFTDSFYLAQARADREKTPFSIVLLDIDNFKNVNDTFGHDVGDHVLTNISNNLAHFFRKNDVIARWGGEEFILILENTSELQAQFIIGSFLEDLQQQTFIAESPNTIVTMSGGISSFPDDGDTIHDLSRAADIQLYASKHAGKNKVTPQKKQTICFVIEEKRMLFMLRQAFIKRGFNVVERAPADILGKNCPKERALCIIDENILTKEMFDAVTSSGEDIIMLTTEDHDDATFEYVKKPFKLSTVVKKTFTMMHDMSSTKVAPAALN
jgi:diguanylate cyclase (GGDEF)-like protein